MEERRFQEFLKEVYAETDREVDYFDNIPTSHEEIDISRKWRFARQEMGRHGLGSFERDNKSGSEVEPKFEAALKPSYDDSRWERINIPHTWNAVDTEDTGPGYWRGIGWYRKSFCISEKYKMKAVRLRIGAANQKSIIWLNGKKVGEHTGGYESFYFDITEHIHWGKETNSLVIRVDNLYDPDTAPTVKTDIQWYGGIYRDVCLYITEKDYFKKAHVSYTGLETGKAEIQLDIALNNKTTATVEAELTDAEGKITAQFQSSIVEGACKIKGPQISDITLWSPEDPYLYKLSLKLISNEKVSDKLLIPVGFRWYEFDPNNGFSLNGVKRKLQGTCWHQVYPGLGNALPVSRHRRDMEVIKEMGVNFFRTSHYPHHDEIMRAADELGIMVFEEMPVNKEIGDPETYTKNMLNRIEETVNNHFNHPSIILWGLAGEVNAPANVSYNVSKQCVARFKELDPTRKTCMHAPRGRAIANLFDVAGYGLRGSEQTDVEGTGAHREHKLSPGITIMDTEYSVGIISRGNWDGGEFSEDGGCKLHEDYLKRINEVPWFCGGAIWHQFDYNGETYDKVIPRVVGFGMTDVWRIPKDVFFFYKSQWNPEPMVHICGHWTWTGEEGELRKVKVYTNGERVDFYQNDKLLSSRHANKNDALKHPPFIFDVVYQPGVIKAVAYFDSHSQISEETHTAGKPYRLEISSSAKNIPYDDYNAHAEITLKVVDKNGHIVPDACIPVTFYLDGVGNLAKQTWAPFGTGTSWYTIAGITRILWRPDGFPGTAVIKAYSPGLLQGRLELLAEYPGDREVDFMMFREFPHEG